MKPVLFGPVAREFFQKRETGDLLEKEVIAAIAAALATPAKGGQLHQQQPAGDGEISAWQMSRRAWVTKPSWRQG